MPDWLYENILVLALIFKQNDFASFHGRQVLRKITQREVILI